MSLLSVTEAKERILSKFSQMDSEIIDLESTLGRILAEDILATDDLPHFDNSSMDGFAIRSEDTAKAANDSPLPLRVVADIPAGTTPKVSISPGEAARIMTGAQMPKGANAVIPVEDTDFNDRSPGTPAPQTVNILKGIRPGENVRPRGMDVSAGEIVLHSKHELTPQNVGLLAMLGLAKVSVYKKPRVAIFSSGDELLEAGQSIKPGKIHDSNSYMLASLVQTTNAEVIRLGIAKDTRESVRNILESAAQQKVDLILSSAGVSVGAFDFVKEAIESNGSLNFWRVNMRPGKPVAFGEYKGTPFIGLPGNPVSAFVGFEVFVRGAISRMAGLMYGTRPVIRARCEEEILSDGRESYLRGIVSEKDGAYTAVLSGHQGSGNLLSLVNANALLIIPAGVKCVPAGQDITAWML